MVISRLILMVIFQDVDLTHMLHEYACKLAEPIALALSCRTLDQVQGKPT